MKLDRFYSAPLICPVLKVIVAPWHVSHGSGVCHVCGHCSGSRQSHAVRVVGKWLEPNWWERLRGVKARFIRSENLDRLAEPPRKSDHAPEPDRS